MKYSPHTAIFALLNDNTHSIQRCNSNHLPLKAQRTKELVIGIPDTHRTHFPQQFDSPAGWNFQTPQNQSWQWTLLWPTHYWHPQNALQKQTNLMLPSSSPCCLSPKSCPILHIQCFQAYWSPNPQPLPIKEPSLALKSPKHKTPQHMFHPSFIWSQMGHWHG